MHTRRPNARSAGVAANIVAAGEEGTPAHPRCYYPTRHALRATPLTRDAMPLLQKL